MNEQAPGAKRPAGEIRVGARAIAAIISRAVRTTRGGGELTGGAAGLSVHDTPSGLRVDVQVRLQYGAPIEQTAAALREQIGAALTRALGRPIAEIHIHVQGLLRN